MDEDRQKKPRTIQMKYPAPYSQSWAENQTKGVKKKKPRVQNMTQIGHAPPHSHSWANDRNVPKRVKKKTPSPRGAGLKKNSDLFSGGPWQPVKQKMSRGPDPTAPHLKYGLFPPPRKTNKSQMQVVSGGVEPKSRTSTPEHSSKKDKKLKNKKEPTPDAGAPFFVFRALDPHRTRQLSLSPPAHLDIRPRPRAYLPPQPLQNEGKVMSSAKTPSLSLSPTKKSFQVLPKKNIN
ncbi:uncharacterized protein LOC135085372 [Ostrinia nubilalis]|uniref:uncharacterized protein LOC135085372 n=1 Tax=Ostrinia nubilalis TaxID=29057 RepID=UPI003082377A